MNQPLRRVLIADDHTAVRRGVRLLLESRSCYLVTEAKDGLAALDEARATRPDIAVIDYSLPGLNGLDLTIALKHTLPMIEVLLFTMHEQEELILNVLRAGARGYVFKGDAEEHLLEAVEALSERRPYFSSSISETLLNRLLSETTSGQTSLSPRERKIVQLIAEGKLNKEIAHVLNISGKTVECHRAAIMQKLRLRGSADLVRYAVRNQLVQP